MEVIKQEEEKAREELSKEVEAKDEKNLAEGNLEIDDPIEIDKTEVAQEILNENDEKLEISQQSEVDHSVNNNENFKEKEKIKKNIQI